MPLLADLRKSDPGLIGVSVGPAFVVSPHASNDFTTPARYLLVTSGGNLEIVNLDGSVCLIQNVAAGTYIMCACKRVNAVNTTVAAGNIIGFP